MSLLPADEPFLSVDGKPALDAALRPILREGRALLPLRSIAKLAGKSVVWDKASWSALIRSEPPAPRTGAYPSRSCGSTASSPLRSCSRFCATG